MSTKLFIYFSIPSVNNNDVNDIDFELFTFYLFIRIFRLVAALRTVKEALSVFPTYRHRVAQAPT